MKIAIIGGTGKMGRWFADFLLKDGKDVILCGRNEHKLLEVKQQLIGVEIASTEKAIKSADAVLVSVPIDSFQAVMEDISPHIQPRQIVADITSIKVMPIETMHKYLRNGTILGTHPMFGPGAISMKNQNFVLTPTTKDEEALAHKVSSYLEKKGAKVIIMSPQEHDDMIAMVLGMSHFIALVSADTLLHFDKLSQTRAVAGTTYKVLLTLIEGVISRDPEFYAALQMSLPNMNNIHEQFFNTAQSWANLIRNKDKHEFIRQMNILREKFGESNPNMENAFDNMYRLIEQL